MTFRSLCCTVLGALSLGAAEPGSRPLVLLYIIDGLRPESITAEDMPTLERLRREGVSYVHTHAAFPTVTRVNAAVLATGAQPSRTGIISNTLYAPGFNDGKPADNGLAENVAAWAKQRGGRAIPIPTLGEKLTAAGRRFVVVSSGSTGQALLLNPEVHRDQGILINGNFEERKRTAFPDPIDRLVQSRFGLRPVDEKGDRLAWTERVLREYVLPELTPDVLYDWMTEPDASQHAFGLGSPESRAALRRCDESLAATLTTLERLGRLKQTAIIVTADHGFIREEKNADVVGSIIRAGHKQGASSTDVVTVSDGHAVQFYVTGRDRAKIRALVDFLQTQPWADVIFVDQHPPGTLARDAAASPYGWLPGTFSLQLIQLAPVADRPDIVLTLPWTSERDALGYRGQQHRNAASGTVRQNQSGHGGMSPWTIRTPLILWGETFKKSTVISVPAGNVDIVPTILALQGLDGSGLDGRPLLEAFRAGPDAEKILTSTQVLETRNDQGFQTALQLSSANGHHYIDKSWNLRR